MANYDGGPAFPRGASPAETLQGVDDSQDGMTLRDYFAVQALLGILTHQGWTSGIAPVLAPRAYECADAMLEERLKQ
ncbi:MAG: hypothetical protein OXC99_01475 [Chloroflexi bacterium]|nr:hypothetical protein [Chloroflexota bacterium]